MNKLWSIGMIVLLIGCKKETIPLTAEKRTDTEIISSGYTKFTILKGNHFCDKTAVASFADSLLHFKAKFDSTAIYQAVNPDNQYDINKLYGFSEGTNHHQNSARIGWSWNKNKLRLYAYVYCNSLRIFKEITSVEIGEEIRCSIQVRHHQYIFRVNNASQALERGPSAPLAEGYWLFPYFGGDEVAPHQIIIYLMNLQK